MNSSVEPGDPRSAEEILADLPEFDVVEGELMPREPTIGADDRANEPPAS